jgi:hypothetical protein
MRFWSTSRMTEDQLYDAKCPTYLAGEFAKWGGGSGDDFVFFHAKQQ